MLYIDYYTYIFIKHVIVNMYALMKGRSANIENSEHKIKVSGQYERSKVTNMFPS